MSDSMLAVTPSLQLAADVAPIRIVLVDAHSERRAVMRHVFEHSDLSTAVTGEADGHEDAVALVDHSGADLVVIDLAPRVEDGLETVAALRRRFPDLAIVVCSFDSRVATAQAARENGADAYLVKPVRARDVMAAVPDHPHQGQQPQRTARSSRTSLN